MVFNISGSHANVIDYFSLKMKMFHCEVYFSAEAESVIIVGMSPLYAHDASVILQCIVTDAFPAPDIAWYRNGQPVPGATSEFLSFTADCLDDGDLYNCEATNSVGSVASSEQVLNVAGQ